MATNNEQNLQRFEAELKRAYEKKVIGRIVTVQKSIGLQGYQMLLIDARTVEGFGSPVWSGRYRGSIRISIGSVDTSVAPEPQGLPNWPTEVKNKVRARPLSEASRKLARLRPFEHVYLSQSLPYARRIETGWSKKTPEGVFGPTVAKLTARFGGVIEANKVL